MANKNEIRTWALRVFIASFCDSRALQLRIFDVF